MSKKEIYRSEVIARVVCKEITQKIAAELLSLNIRHIKRLCKRYNREGALGLIHQGRGKPSSKRINSSISEKILELIQTQYLGFGPQLLKEQLEKHQIKVSSEWLRILMVKHGFWQSKKRSQKRCFQRRPRRPRIGELLQIDGSPAKWFEDRGEECTLINMVDDATGQIMACKFVKEECLQGYFDCMNDYISRCGRPLSVYSDRHTIFKSPKNDPSKLSQFGRAMKELEIELIYANTPQAKGRVERVHGTLQDRLIKLMRLDGISTIEEGNAYLEDFRIDYNKRFGKPAESSQDAHRALPEYLDLSRVLCRKEKRMVFKSLEIAYKGKIYLIDKKHVTLIRKKVDVLEHEQGTRIEYEGKGLKYHVLSEVPYEENVLDRKRIDAFLNRKKPMTVIERRRKQKTG